MVGKQHPLADPNGYAYDHVLIWVAAGNAAPGMSHVVHHKNGNKLDNRIGNLELIGRDEHARMHRKNGRFVSWSETELDGRVWAEEP
jgi:hypothetical protein